MNLYYRIIAQDKDYLVVDKPAGLLSHGADHIKEEDSLIEMVLRDFPEISRVGEDPARPGLMHRLDKQVSGLLVIARTEAAFDSLKKQFQQRSVEKTYTALVFGRLEKDHGEINFPIARSSQGRKMAALPSTVKGSQNPAGRTALSEFTLIKKFINYSLLEVRIKTGRTHQIRVHMSAYGHPLVGDDLYGTAKTKIKNRKLGLDRIFLHACRLEFHDLAGRRQSFSSALPAELEEFLARVK